ncbi:hypothetical protein D917_07024 [Trichinella nativa]|uniref:Uncharacterized protein n=1 Tax=Trichinella nativa TaxID=6335 RepID=A0A1Y3ETX6_9BILA|nr:hypothetical protein D917_07024 [Trichinella nativa]
MILQIDELARKLSNCTCSIQYLFQHF